MLIFLRALCTASVTAAHALRFGPAAIATAFTLDFIIDNNGDGNRKGYTNGHEQNYFPSAH